MEKRDLKKELAALYGPSAREVVRVEIPEWRFLMVDGQGDPNTSREYGEAVEALYALSYTLKFAVKKGPLAIDYGVMPLEALWWSDDMASFASGERDAWRWTAMIMQPGFVDAGMVAQASEAAAAKKSLPALAKVRFESFAEGAAAQIMHVGPFTTEGPTIERVHDFIEESGCARTGKHHEIYLTDIRKADPAKWRTVIRQPMGRCAT